MNWLIDGVAPDRKTAAAVIGTFKQAVKGGELRMHPIVGRLVDKDVLEKLRAKK